MSAGMNTLKKLTAFSVPLILSGLLQQLFNWVDALIVGNFIGEAALAGVGATSALYNLFITALLGFTSGLSVLFAQQYGEGKHGDNARLLARHSVLLTAAAVVVALLGIGFIDFVLKLMDTPAPLIHDAREYLRVILTGIPFLALYNVYAAALRGMGNSRAPFVAVLISSAANAVLDYVFIVLCGGGVGAAAAATVLSQVVMTLYTVLYTTVRHPQMRFAPWRLRACRGAGRAGAKYGAPLAVQSSVSSIGNLFLQRFMNGFGGQTVAAITTAYRVDSVLFLPIINFSAAISTLVAQETGAGDHRAARRIFRLGTAMMAVMSLTLTLVILMAGRALMSIFGLTAESVRIGERFFRSIAGFYLIYGLSMSIRGYLEGTSDLMFSGVIGVCSLGVRILCSYLFCEIWGNMVVAYAEAISWIFLLSAFALRYWTRKRRGEGQSRGGADSAERGARRA